MRTKKIFLAALLAAAVPAAFAAQTGQAGAAYQSYLKALLLESQGNFAGAKVEVERALEIAPSSAYLHRTASELSLRLGQIGEASREIDRAIELDPKDVQSLIISGQIHWATGDAEVAIQRLRKALSLDPDESEALVSLAGALGQKNPQEAIKLYNEFLLRHPNEVEIRERLAQQYQSSGDAAKAKKTWEDVLSNAPNSVRAHLALAQIAEVALDTPTAISHYNGVLSQDPANLPLLLRVGELQYRSNDMAKAFEAFTKAQTIAPTSPGANFWLALLAEHRGDWLEAIRLLKNVPAAGRESGVQLRLSYYYSQAGQYKNAINVLKSLSNSDPSNADFLNYLAVAYEQNKQTADAEKTLQRIVDIDPNDPEAHFHLATLYDRMGRFDKAEEELRAAIRLKPDFHMAMNYLGYSFADRNIHLDEAEQLLINAIALDPDNPAYLDSMAWVYFRQGKLDRARDFIREATSRIRDPLIWEHYGDIQLAGGDVVDAILCWDESLRLDPDGKAPRVKTAKAMKRVSNADKVGLFVKRAISNFGDIDSVNGLVYITVCPAKSCFKSNAQFSYARGDEMKIEIPGPLTGPVMILTKPSGAPAQYGALHPQFQTVGPEVTRAFDRIDEVFEGGVFKDVDMAEFSRSAVDNRRSLTATAGRFDARFEANSGALQELDWRGPDMSETLSFGPYRTPQSATLPKFIEWRSGDGFTIRVDFLNPAVGSSAGLPTAHPGP